MEGYSRPAETKPLIFANLLEAKARDPDLNDAHGEEATYRFAYEWDWDGAEQAWRRAMRGRGAEMDTNLWLVRSMHQWALGRVDAFAAAAAGVGPDGYHADDDLLPGDEP